MWRKFVLLPVGHHQIFVNFYRLDVTVVTVAHCRDFKPGAVSPLKKVYVAVLVPYILTFSSLDYVP